MGKHRTPEKGAAGLWITGLAPDTETLIIVIMVVVGLVIFAPAILGIGLLYGGWLLVNHLLNSKRQ